MRIALILAIASSIPLTLGCASAPRDPAPAVAASSVAAAEEPPGPVADTTPARADRCIEAASTEPFIPFHPPTADRPFQRHLRLRVDDLRCCFTDARRPMVAGTTLRVAFDSRSHDPDDGADGRLVLPDDPGRPEEQRCLRTIVSSWEMTPAPTPDVVRDPPPERPPSVSLSLAL